VTTDVSYGATFNLGNYENERIDIRITVEDGETPDAALARAKAFVAAAHAATVAERERAERIAGARDAIRNLDYWIAKYDAEAKTRGLRVVVDVPARPENDDELVQLQWEVQRKEIERDAMRDTVEKARMRERQRAASQDDGNDEEDDEEDEDSDDDEDDDGPDL
jgi:hypothetical protein